MPRCPKCGKKFQTLSALNDHSRTVHPNERFIAPKGASPSRNLVIGLVIVILVIGALVGILIYFQATSKPPTTTNNVTSGILGTPINDTLYNQMTGVSYSTLASVGYVSASAGTANGVVQTVSGQPLNSGGKPEILYVGADYCPHCAYERWAIVVALSKFGTFSNLSYMLSAADDGNISTVTFYGSSYTSNYITFVTVETTTRDRNTQLQILTSDQQSLMNKYDSAGFIPFIDIYNKYALTGAQDSNDVSLLSGLNWSQIGSELNSPNSNIAKGIDGAANLLISAICNADGQQPSSVCGQSFAKLLLQYFPYLLRADHYQLESSRS